MKRAVLGVAIYPLNLPFVESFRHATADRRASDSVLVRLTLDDGTVGWGEGVPRPYVTGETQARMVKVLGDAYADVLLSRTFEAPRSLNDLADFVPDVEAPMDERVIADHASRCAVELALLDALLRSEKRSLSTLLPPRTDRVRYSAAITATSEEASLRIARRLKLVGFHDWKVKVGCEEDGARLVAMRGLLGHSVSLRVDANAAWTLGDAVEQLHAWRPIRLDAVEEPLGRARMGDLARLRASGVPPIVVDESLVTSVDAESLIQMGAADIFNLRLSKVGGIGPALRLARLATEAGLGVQLGCQVGETAILSAAGRHVAAYLKPRFVEGSFGAHLLAEDVSQQPVSFGHGGFGALLKGPGLGVDVRAERVERYATGVVRLGESEAP